MSINNSIDINIDLYNKQSYQNVIFNLSKSISLIFEKLLFFKSKNVLNLDFVEKETIFDIKKIPNMNIDNYIKRIVKYSKPEPQSLISALIYIDKICEKEKIFITKVNVYKLVLICIMISMKYNEDDINSNAFFAKVGGIDLENLNQIENKTYEILNYDLYIDDNLYQKYEDNLSLFMSNYDLYIDDNLYQKYEDNLSLFMSE